MASRRHLIELHVAVLLFGGAGLFAELVDLSAPALTLGRTVVAAVFVGAAVAVTGTEWRLRSRRDLVAVTASGVVLAVHWSAFFRSIQVSSVSVAVVSVSTFPVFTALLESLVARRRPTPADLGLAGLAVLGIAVITWPLQLGAATTVGVAWGTLAAALFAVLAVVNSRLVGRHASQTVAGYQYLVAALVLAPIAGAELTEVDGGDTLLVIVVGVVFTGVAHTLFLASMRTIRSETASLTVGLEPVYGVTLAWLVLGQRPSPRVVAGGALVLVAVLAGTRRTVRAAVPLRPARGGAGGLAWRRCTPHHRR
ncbi:MAG: DMT family transporter [Acidimicrobiales bacterium]